VSLPELSEEFQGPAREWDIAVLVALASDMEEHAVAVDIGDLEGSAFGQAQTAGIDGGEANPMSEHVDAGEGSSDLLEAQYSGEGFDPLGFDKPDGGPVPFEGVLIEEFDAAQGDGAGHPGPSGDIGAIEEIMPQFFIGDQVWGFMVVFGEFEDGPGVGLLGSR